MRSRTQVSDSRKSLHAFGTILVAIGAVVAIGGAISFFSSFGSPGDMFAESFPPKGFLIAAGGILLTGVGRGLRHLGARGIAGSGLVLDPERAADDLAPWARTGGRLMRDAVDASGLVTADDGDVPAGAADGSGATGARVKVRCRECRTLNDEDARFCDQCGASL
ncbi:MAG: zinc-ribbon domain-containing protein [Planctomycetota bacterium]